MNEDHFNRLNKHVWIIIDWYKPDGVLEVKYKLMYDGENKYIIDLIFVVNKEDIIIRDADRYIQRYYSNLWSNKIKLAIMNYLNISIIDGECNIVSDDALYETVSMRTIPHPAIIL